jgi:hypothetical protein
LDREELRGLGERIRAIADDCFDLRAVERLRKLADEIERATGVPPIILTRESDASGRSENN